jgi:type IV fimbrial biogenesis protein FimT
MLHRHTSRGISVIELMVVVTIIGMMLMLAMPGIGNWIANSRVRTVSDEVQNALRLAQAEAVNRNRQVAFVRTAAAPARNATPSASGNNWYIQVLPLNATEAATTEFQDTAYLQGGAFSTQSGAAVAGPALVCFNSVGRVVNNNATALGDNCVAPTTATDPTDLDVTLASSNRAMRVELFLGGRVRLCDVSASTSQPNACTP